MIFCGVLLILSQHIPCFGVVSRSTCVLFSSMVLESVGSRKVSLNFASIVRRTT